MNNTVLVVKNLPEASLNMREIFSSYYPTSIKPFGRRRVLLTFPDPQYANFVLHKLHQTEVAGRIISVEYYRFGKQFQRDESSTEKMPRIPTYLKKLYAMCDGLRLDEPPPPYLKYDYPKINNDILDSISIALLSNAKFYTQVIHLMNRMNMDPPFGPKKVYLCPTKSSSEFREIATQTDPVAFASDVESELESDSERISRPKKISRKRKLPDNEELLKQKVKQMIHVTSQIKTKSIHKEKKDLCNIFEIKKPFVEHKIAMNFKKVKLAESVVENVEKLTPSVVEFVPPDDLKSNRIPESQLSELPVFKNYKKGNPSNKLYIKNLNKDVTDIDLRSIYEKFTSPLEIKVMQQGRMKGQAFVTFTKLSDDQGNIVENALNETNGFILKNKPMVVCFGKKQLGLLETIYVDAAGRQHSSRRHKMQKLAVQPYDYVIAVDFEATCWENIAPPKWRESEIIEFPAVLINLKTGKIEAEFHKYIMPIESPKLSAFCTELTGITQKIVDTGIPLQTALMMFHEWLRKELRTRNLHLPKMSKDNKIGNCAFVTWSDWDFGICLAKECQRKRLKKPPFFNQWVDLRAIFREWYNYKPINFSDALLHVGLEFEGREHAGIDDAKNLAALACKMVKDGASLAITKDLTPFQLNMNF